MNEKIVVRDVEKEQKFLQFGMQKDPAQKIRGILSLVEREGMKELCEFLEKTDFYTAPASAKHHLNRPGGLVQHHWNITWNLFQKNIHYALRLPLDSVILIGALHDACKIGLYDKQLDGSYKYDYSVLKRGHGKLSVERIEKFITLTEQERDAIRFHMNLFYAEETHESYYTPEYTVRELQDSIKKYPLTQIFASCDMECTCMEDALDGKSS